MCRRRRSVGLARHGSSRETSQLLWIRSIIRSCHRRWQRIHDGRFPRLLRNMLQADTWKTGYGPRQRRAAGRGGLPVLSNIYLHRLAVSSRKSASTVTRGDSRAPSPEYYEAAKQLARLRRRGTAQRPARCAGRCGECRARTRKIRGSGGCATCGTAMTTSSGSPDPRPKRKKSRSVLRRSCVMNSGWNCRGRRH